MGGPSWSSNQDKLSQGVTTIYTKLLSKVLTPHFLGLLSIVELFLEIRSLFWRWSSASCGWKTHEDLEAVVDTPF